eukprot:7091211-Lingulodinium_polyedra.AAC.1
MQPDPVWKGHPPGRLVWQITHSDVGSCQAVGRACDGCCEQSPVRATLGGLGLARRSSSWTMHSGGNRG